MSDIDAPEAKRMTLGEHLEELRKRILYAVAGLVAAMVASLALGRWTLRLLQRPFEVVMREYGMDERLAVLSTTAGIGVYFQVALIAGAMLASPWIFYQLWLFVSAGLYPRERRYVTTAVPSSAGLFIAGAAFYLFVMAVPMLRFLIGFGNWLGVKPIVTLEEHIRQMTTMMLVCGLSFQMPLVVLILAKMGLVTLAKLHHFRRHVIVAILLVAAIATPSPSPLDQIILAVPMWLLYELGVLLVYLLVARKQRTPAD
jgi:sec-independent protein translocase protein TatC